MKKELNELTTEMLPIIKQHISESQKFFNNIFSRWNEWKKFIFVSSVTKQEESILNKILKPTIQFNVLEAYISRLRGEYYKQLPNIEVSADSDFNINKSLTRLVDGHIRHLFYESNKTNCNYQLYTNTLSGGFDVLKIWTEYANYKSFNQVIKFGRVYDPTMCGFDPNAQMDHKGDGRFCFEKYVKTYEEFTEQFPDVDLSNVTFTTGSKDSNGNQKFAYKTKRGQKILVILDFYLKKPERTKVLHLSDGRDVTKEEYDKILQTESDFYPIEKVLSIVDERISIKNVVTRYRITENQIIEKAETNFEHLPLIFVDGNSVFYRDSNEEEEPIVQFTRPYIYNAIGMQKLINYSGQTLANEIENMQQSKIKIPLDAIPTEAEYQKAYLTPQLMSVLIYNQFKNNDPNVRLDPPQEIVRQQIPQEIITTFIGGNKMIQQSLGTYDAALGINDNQLSGTAIEKGSLQSNAAAEPYIISIMSAFTRVAEIFINLMPKYYKTPMTLPIIDEKGHRDYIKINDQGTQSLFYDSNVFNVQVEAGVNYSIQKSNALKQIIGLMQASPTFSQFINTEGLEILLDNVDIRGIDQLKAMAGNFMEQQKIQQQQMQQNIQSQQMNSPEAITAQAYREKVYLDARNNEVKNQLKAAELSIDERNANNEELKTLAEIEDDKLNKLVQIDKHNAEKTRAAVDLAIKAADLSHKHKKDVINLSKNNNY